MAKNPKNAPADRVRKATAPAPNKALAASASKSAVKSSRESTKEARIEAMERFIRSSSAEFLARPNVNSLGIGYKVVGGKRTSDLAIQFAVLSKAAQPEAIGLEPLPISIFFEGMEFPTDVVERKFTVDYALVEDLEKDTRKQRLAIIVPGISVGHSRTTAGTLGAIVRDRTTGKPVMLSNWHVLQTPWGQLGDPVAQPGPYDDNRVKQNRVGALVRSHLGVAGDCAIASLEARTFKGEVFEVGTAVARVGKAELDDKVVKSGRTTGVTRGIVTRVSTMSRIDYGNGIVEDIGGFEIGPDVDQPAPANEISKGGDSGSAWMAIGSDDKPTDIMLGLHFAGEDADSDGEYALASQAHSVFEKLEIEPLPLVELELLAARPQDLAIQGYDRNFLGEALPIPTFTAAARSDLAVLEGEIELRYCHFSVWLSRDRRLPRLVAWNIDGKSIKYLGRKNMRFRKDERGNLEEYQIGNELYADNPFDRGHIARRADLCWGDEDEADRANKDSFYFTNMSPQHEGFNQSKLRGLWGKLENAIFEEAEPKDLKVSLLAGPVLARDDPRYRKPETGIDIRVPVEFWKIVIFRDTDGKLALRGYILTQRDLVKDLVEAETMELDEFRWYQVPIEAIAAKTGVRFPQGLSKLEKIAQTEALEGGAPGGRLIRSSADFFT